MSSVSRMIKTVVPLNENEKFKTDSTFNIKMWNVENHKFKDSTFNIKMWNVENEKFKADSTFNTKCGMLKMRSLRPKK